MITEKQKQKMLECLRDYNFCDSIDCRNCPLRKGEEELCGRNVLQDVIRKIEIELEPEKKLCPTCGHELDKEIEE